jgi:hypothetical protein
MFLRTPEHKNIGDNCGIMQQTKLREIPPTVGSMFSNFVISGLAVELGFTVKHTTRYTA